MKMLRNGLFILMALFASNVNAQFTTNLPIIIITTPGVIGATQIQGSISVIDNLSGVNTPLDPPTYTGMVGIKTRGNIAYPKVSYSVETWSAPFVSLNVSMLGLPIENDWVLMGNYSDRSLMRNVIAMNLHEKMGRYAPRMKPCEVIVNNQYVGIYDFGEQIKRDIGRLDIATLTVNDNFGHEMTGGYIWKIDGSGAGWQSSFNPPYAVTQKIDFEYDYPDNSDITPAQKAYIKSYVDSFEAELNGASFQDTLLGWRKHGAVNSFVDFMIMQELGRNIEAYRQNCFFYKDKGTKMRPGPLWGFDNAWKNTADCNSSLDTGWCFNYGAVCGASTKLVPFWWQKLTTDTLFMRDLRCRYREFRNTGNVLDTVEIFKTIDSISTRLNANGAVSRNFVQWPIWGVPIVNEPTPMAMDYATEIANLKQFIKSRLAWLDSKWPKPSNCPIVLATDQVDLEQMVAIYPIPTYDKINIEISDAKFASYHIRMFNLQGNEIFASVAKGTHNQIDVSGVAKGIYILQITSAEGAFVKKVVVE